FVAQCAQSREHLPALLRIIVERRHRHQAMNANTSTPRQLRCEGGQLVRSEPLFRGLTARVHFEENRRLLRKRIESVQQTKTIDGMDESNEGSRAFDLVALQMTDKVPAHAGRQESGLAP